MIYLLKYPTFKLALEKLERCKMSKKLKNNKNPTVSNKRLGFLLPRKGAPNHPTGQRAVVWHPLAKAIGLGVNHD